MKAKIVEYQVFGKLMVLKKVSKDEQGNYLWLCRCLCGKQILRSSANLNRAKNKLQACNSGCSRSKPPEEVALNIFWYKYKKGAKERGLELELTKKQFVSFLMRPCHYCGKEPETKRIMGKYSLKYNGLDRVDNEKGYSEQNCVSCCKECNYMKRSMDVSKFLLQARKIGRYQRKLRRLKFQP